MRKEALAGVLLVAVALPARAIACGDILVSSFYDDAVVRFDEATGSLLGTFTTGTSPIGPEGLAFGANGNLLVVSREANSVLEYDRNTGAFVRFFINEGLDSPHGMIKDPAGDLLIASRGGVMKYDGTTGALLGVFAEIPGPLIDLDYGPNGNLFVADPAHDSVLEVDSLTGAVLGTFASGGGMESTNQILFGGPRSDLFVGGDDPHGIFQYDGRNGAFVGLFASGSGMEYPGPVLVHPNGNLLVASGYGDPILEFDFVTGTLVRTFANKGLDFPTFALEIPEPGMMVMVILAGVMTHRRVR